MTADNGEYWQGFAQRWSRLGPPLRPCAEDVEHFRRTLGDAPGRCLLLGVTPELATIAPSLTAIDNSAAMIKALWPEERKAVLGDWLDMPFTDGSFDSIVGDGCLVLLSEPGQHERFFRQLERVLVPGGRVALRVFINPERSETRAQVCADALAGRMQGVHAFKWRLSMAIAAESTDFTVSVTDTSATFDRLIPDRATLAAATGWRTDEIETIDFYRGSAARYCYPTLSRVRAALPPALLEKAIIRGNYELAERCPILVLERQA